jgi:hypothetical protein
MAEYLKTGEGKQRPDEASRSGDGRSPARCRRPQTENLLVEILTLIL